MKILEDILFLLGFLFILVPIFLLNLWVGCSILVGFILLFASLIIANKEKKET